MGHLPEDDGREVFADLFAVPLDGGDFVLRHACEPDLAHLPGLVDDELRERLTLPETVDEAFMRLVNLHGGAVLIVDRLTDTPLGGMRLFLHGDAVEFGYWLGAEARGRGLATRALALASEAVVARLRPARLELRTTVGNHPSERVAERAGFVRIGAEPPLEYPGGRIIETTLWIRELGEWGVPQR